MDPGRHGLRVSSLDIGIAGLAAELAEAAGGSVRVIHCVHVPPVSLSIRTPALRRERARVAEMVRHIARDAGLSSRDVRIAEGPAVEGLLDAVTSEAADVLVLGTVVRGPVAQLVLGSTTEQLLHVAPCDLLLVKPDSVRRRPRRRAAR